MTCDFCKKPITEATGSQTMCLLKPKEDLLLLEKHLGCGPPKKCFYQNCKRDRKTQFLLDSGTEPFDIDIGFSETQHAHVWVNYCSRRCARKDDQYLEENWDELEGNMKKKATVTVGGVDHVILMSK